MVNRTDRTNGTQKLLKQREGELGNGIMWQSHGSCYRGNMQVRHLPKPDELGKDP